MHLKTTGIHHVTAMCGDPQRNIDFYSGLLGLRLVKTTVNYDDPGTYHLYYGDGIGSPGTLITFFPWPGGYQGSVGTRQVGVTAFAVPPGSLDFWQKRLETAGVVTHRDRRFEEEFLAFADPDDMLLELVEDPTADPAKAWSEGGVPADQAIRGFHRVELWLETLTATERLLEHTFGARVLGTAIDRTRVAFAEGHAGQVIDLLCLPGRAPGRTGIGAVHHVAFGVPTAADHEAWHNALSEHGLYSTPIRDRTYFESIYYREPGGVLFEMATNGPGMAIDEEAGHLGEKLSLPTWLEGRREQLRRSLSPLRHPAGVDLP